MAMDPTNAAGLFGGLATEVRGKTLLLLDHADKRACLWAPPGLSNHLLWHAGHALWLQDLMDVEACTGASELPAGWEETFGQHCRPVRQTTDWPDKSEVSALLRRQLSRLLEIFETLTPDALAAPPRGRRLGRGRPLVYWIIHGLHDEANHQGEMWLLLKMQRTG
jgi:hypothetical protein